MMSDFPWEDGLLERKTEGDLRDLLKTLVAFANSVRPGHVATILIGEKDDGTAQGVTNPDNIQKKVREECDKIYPAIIWRSQVYEKEGKHCVRVEVEYSGDTPHFGGIAWVRKGSETIKATDEMFQRLVEIRSARIRELAKWRDKTISIEPDLSSMPPSDPPIGGDQIGRILDRGRTQRFHLWDYCQVKLIELNQHWITVETEAAEFKSIPYEKIFLSFDHTHNCLKVHVLY